MVYLFLLFNFIKPKQVVPFKMTSNLWNVQSPTKRIDFYFKIDVMHAYIIQGLQETPVAIKECEEYHQEK